MRANKFFISEFVLSVQNEGKIKHYKINTEHTGRRQRFYLGRKKFASVHEMVLWFQSNQCYFVY